MRGAGLEPKKTARKPASEPRRRCVVWRSVAKAGPRGARFRGRPRAGGPSWPLPELASSARRVRVAGRSGCRAAVGSTTRSRRKAPVLALSGTSGALATPGRWVVATPGLVCRGRPLLSLVGRRSPATSRVSESGAGSRTRPRRRRCSRGRDSSRCRPAGCLAAWGGGWVFVTHRSQDIDRIVFTH